MAIIPGIYRKIKDNKWVFLLHHRGVSTFIRCIFYLLYHFISLTGSIWSDAIFKILSKSVKYLHFSHFIFFFFFEWKIECMQLWTRNIILSVLSLWWKYLFVQACAQCFPKEKLPHNHDNKQFMQKMQLWRERLNFGI